jgi:hypothetical protein
MGGLGLNQRGGGNQLAGLACDAHIDKHLAGLDRLARPRPRRRKAAQHQLDIEPPSFAVVCVAGCHAVLREARHLSRTFRLATAGFGKWP